MKKLTLILAMASLYLGAKAQQDTVSVSVQVQKNDTMRIGNILIIKKGKKGVKSDSNTVVMSRNDRQRKQNSKVSTNYFVLDLGFANYNDQTNYANAGSYLVNRPGSPAFSENDFKLKAGKSINVNIWFFMQRLSLVKRNVNLKYGLGLELNNYRFKSPLTFRENGTIPYTAGTQTTGPFIFRDSIAFSKNKLAADYLTVPLMLNFASNNASKNKGISVSVGVSAGYLYSQRNKQKSDERGKQKNKGEYDLERFKLSYVGELGIGPVRLYGSYSPKSMFDHSLDIRPYNLGFRFSNW